MSINKLYQDLDNEIKANISKTDDFYKSLNIQNITNIDLSEYKIELGDNYDEYHQQLWKYLSARYSEQTKLKKHYFNLENKLMDKKSIIQDQYKHIIAEYDKNNNDNQVAISEIKNDKYEIEQYTRNNKIMIYIMLYLICIIFVIILNIIKLLSNNISIFLILIIIIMIIINVGYNWYIDNNRNNNNWNLRDYNVTKNEEQKQCNNENLVAINLENNNKKNIDAQVKSVIDDSIKDK